jgi:hypothetical protein
MNIIKLLLIVSTFQVFSFNVNATLIQTDDLFNVGDGLLITDTVSGVQWISPRALINLSSDDIAGGALGITTTHGFKFASLLELSQLYADMGMPKDHRLLGGGVIPTNHESTQNIIDLVEAFGCIFNCTRFDQFMNGDFSGDFFGGVFSRLLQEPGGNSTMSLIVLNDSPGSVRLDTRTTAGSSANSMQGFWMYKGDAWSTNDYNEYFELQGPANPNPTPSVVVPEPPSISIFMLLGIVLITIKKRCES